MSDPASKRRWYSFSTSKVAVALLFALPGITLAVAAKPLLLGDAILFLGVLLAVVLPI